MSTGPFIVTHRQPCEDCHGTGERHPTTRAYMSHEIHDCETCERRGEVIVYRKAFATLDEAQAAVRKHVRVACDAMPDAMQTQTSPFELPDESVIEVEQINWPTLASVVKDGAYLPEPHILATWNAENGIGIRGRA